MKPKSNWWYIIPGRWNNIKGTAFLVLVSGLLTMVLISCNSDYTPKPRGYYRIDFPERKYQVFDQPGYPYSFEYPVYANIVKDSTFFGEATENPWWINVDFPQFAGRIYVSYKEIGKNKFDTLIKHAFLLTGKHSARAYSIDDSVLATPLGVHGVFFSVGGDAATANQFFLTDSTKHFLRGALYFDAAPNADSLGIVNSFLLEDMKHLINTFRWKK
jgi:gliding motility-associated lipoprotein GldD